MNIVLVLLSTIAVSSSAILFPYAMDEHKVSYDQTNRLGKLKDSISKVKLLKSFDNKEDNLESRNMIQIEDFGNHNALRISKGNTVATIESFQNQTINNQDKVQPKRLRNKFNFYAKRIYKNNNNEKNKSIESKIRNFEIASNVKFIKKTKYSTEEKQDQKEFIFMKNKNIAKNKRRKRSSNIIEEENLFTTVSALKYTGRDARLTNDLYFKNINQ